MAISLPSCPRRGVTPAGAGAGIQKKGKTLDSRVRGNDTVAISLPWGQWGHQWGQALISKQSVVPRSGMGQAKGSANGSNLWLIDSLLAGRSREEGSG